MPEFIEAPVIVLPCPEVVRSASPVSSTPVYWDTAVAGLCSADPILAMVIEPWAGERLAMRGDAFLTLSRAIVGQQISVKAAQSIWDRLNRVARTMTPQRLARMRIATLRAAGLSERKAEYLRDLAVHFLTGQIKPDRWPLLDDEDVIAELVAVRGIGRWTAEMFLMFNLMRPDVLPLDDVGLLKAISLHYNDGVRVSREVAAGIAARWQPWRTVAAWYLWRSLDPLPVEY